jgi:uncharacterized protein (UPF0276 family)
MVIGVGFTLQPDELFLDLLSGVALEHADYFEVAPETLWAEHDELGFVPNGYHAQLRALGEHSGKPFVAHGVGLSLASNEDDSTYVQRWRAQLARDAALFGFRWFTEHLGASTLAGQTAILPLPVPMTRHAATLVRARLRALQAIVPDVGIENTCHYFMPGDPLREPRFIARILHAPRTHLLLDLHNLVTMARNLDFDPYTYLSQLNLARVIEIHVSGGADSDPRWLPDGATLRLDSHDAAVPEPVWSLLEQVAPRCPNLRGVTLERMEGTVDQHSIPALREELTRIRRTLP